MTSRADIILRSLSMSLTRRSPCLILNTAAQRGPSADGPGQRSRSAVCTAEGIAGLTESRSATGGRLRYNAQVIFRSHKHLGGLLASLGRGGGTPARSRSDEQSASPSCRVDIDVTAQQRPSL